MFFVLAAVLVALGLALLGLVAWIGFRLTGRRYGRKLGRAWFWGCLVCYPGVVLVGIPLLLASLISSSGTRPGDLKLKSDPGRFGCDFEPVSFDSFDGITLRGWWMRGTPESSVLVMTHGLFRDRKEVVERGCRLNQVGHSVLVFDLRGHGTSDEAPITLGYKERLDVLGAVQFVRRRQSSPVVLFGVSMGAAAALMAATEMTEPPAAVVADSSFTGLRETVERHVRLFLGAPSFPLANIFLWNLARLGSFEPEAFDLIKAMQQTDGWPPTLLIYGSEDRRMPPETARTLFEAVPTPLKKIVFFPGAGHGHSWDSGPEKYLSELEDFLQTSVSGGAAALDPARGQAGEAPSGGVKPGR